MLFSNYEVSTMLFLSLVTMLSSFLEMNSFWKRNKHEEKLDLIHKKVCVNKNTLFNWTKRNYLLQVPIIHYYTMQIFLVLFYMVEGLFYSPWTQTSYASPYHQVKVNIDWFTSLNEHRHQVTNCMFKQWQTKQRHTFLSTLIARNALLKVVCLVLSSQQT